MSAKQTSESLPTLLLDGGIKYKGQIKAGVPHGIGKMVWPNGDYYKGDFYEGKRQGKGKRVNMDGSEYTGEYHND